jgi:hypothetical protein
VIVWIIIYHLGYREGFVIDGFKSKQACETAIIQIQNDSDSIWKGNDWALPHCVGVKK